MPCQLHDTRLRAILCGLRGFEHRSTNARGVPCPACIGLLGKRPPASAQVATKYLA